MAKVTNTLETLRQKDVKALQQELADVRVALQKARVDLAFGRLPKPSEVMKMRKQIARIQTVLSEKEAVNA